jgi:hypothetical protein
MIDVVFEASMAEVLDDHMDDPAAEGRAVRPGDHRRLGRAEGQGHRLDQADALPGRPRGPGAGVGYVRGGMGMVSFAIADAAQEAGATLAAGVPVGEVLPGEGAHPAGSVIALNGRNAAMAVLEDARVLT